MLFDVEKGNNLMLTSSCPHYYPLVEKIISTQNYYQI